MSSVFCRGCGQSIHAEALACPKCGAPQRAVAGARAQEHPTLAVISCVIAGITLLVVLGEDLDDRDTAVGSIMLALASGVCGAISLQLKKPGHILAVIGTVASAIFLLAGIGSLR